MKRDVAMQQVTIRMTAQRAFELRFVLPIVAEALSGEPNATDTEAMLAEAVEDINRALPSELRELVDEDQINEWRMDAVEKQVEAGVRGAPPPNLLTPDEARDVAQVLRVSKRRRSFAALAKRLADFAAASSPSSSQSTKGGR